MRSDRKTTARKSHTLCPASVAPASVIPESGIRKKPLLEEIHYREGKKIGAGGVGVVFKAEDAETGKEVVIKRLRETDALDPVAIELLMVEISALARLSHPNIVELLGDGFNEKGPYIALEYVEGPTLEKCHLRKSLTADKILEICQKVCDALTAVHEAGIVHRDVAPKNIMVSETAEGLRVKLLDFGTAKIEGYPDPYGGVAVGTPKYSSPENLFCRPGSDLRSDIYSLGATMYELITGDPPVYSGGVTSLEAMLELIKNTPIRSLKNIPITEHSHPIHISLAQNPAALAAVSAMLESALAKVADERYGSAKDMQEDIRRCRKILSNS